jgi:hypothetical protein
MHELDFEDESIFDIDGNEWIVSGTYYADMDRSGEYEFDGFKTLSLCPIDGTCEPSEWGYAFPDQFSEAAISKFSERLAQKLYDKLTGGQS